MRSVMFLSEHGVHTAVEAGVNRSSTGVWATVRMTKAIQLHL